MAKHARGGNVTRTDVEEGRLQGNNRRRDEASICEDSRCRFSPAALVEAAAVGAKEELERLLTGRDTEAQ
jgi:hypothetical protein